MTKLDDPTGRLELGIEAAPEKSSMKDVLLNRGQKRMSSDHFSGVVDVLA